MLNTVKNGCGIRVDHPPCFFKITTFSRFFFGRRPLFNKILKPNRIIMASTVCLFVCLFVFFVCLFDCLFVCLLFVLSKLPLGAKKNNTFLFLKFKFKSRDRAELGSYGSGKSLGFLPLLNLRSGKSLVTCPFLSVSRQG